MGRGGRKEVDVGGPRHEEREEIYSLKAFFKMNGGMKWEDG